MTPRVVNLDTGKDVDLWSFELHQDSWGMTEITFSTRERNPHNNLENKYYWTVMRRTEPDLLAILTNVEVHYY